ncbi:MAG: hypothetical protein IH986_13060 [Planctomycetes bacterium]|nr:hypothetical protein [Planctomycetota bacterium]
MAVCDSDAAKRTLEAMLDTHGIGSLIDWLADVCHEKAEHVRSNWQDAALADAWEGVARELDRRDASDIP